MLLRRRRHHASLLNTSIKQVLRHRSVVMFHYLGPIITQQKCKLTSSFDCTCQFSEMKRSLISLSNDFNQGISISSCVVGLSLCVIHRVVDVTFREINSRGPNLLQQLFFSVSLLVPTCALQCEPQQSSPHWTRAMTNMGRWKLPFSVSSPFEGSARSLWE